MKKLILGLVLASMVFSGCGQSKTEVQSDTVMTINEDNISLEEFNIYLYETQKSFEQLGGSDIWETDFDGRTAESVAKDNTYNTVLMVKLAAQQGEKEGIELDESAKADIRVEAEEMYNNLDEGKKEQIGADSQLYYDVLSDNALYNLVYEETVKDFVVTDAEFNSFYLENKDSFTQYYKTNVDSTEPINENALRDYSRAYYQELTKQQYFNKEYDKWKSGASVSRNDSVWNSIELIK